jgi:hypothetical protein
MSEPVMEWKGNKEEKRRKEKRREEKRERANLSRKKQHQSGRWKWIGMMFYCLIVCVFYSVCICV